MRKDAEEKSKEDYKNEMERLKQGKQAKMDRIKAEKAKKEREEADRIQADKDKIKAEQDRTERDKAAAAAKRTKAEERERRLTEMERLQHELEMEEKELDIIERQKRVTKKKEDIHTGLGADEAAVKDDAKENVEVEVYNQINELNQEISQNIDKLMEDEGELAAAEVASVKEASEGGGLKDDYSDGPTEKKEE